jgi:acetylornithine deacetylase/succinyl-diaminopimelate desuccinylase-like protein
MAAAGAYPAGGGCGIVTAPMSDTLPAVLKTLDDRREASLDALKQFLRIPSISTQSEHKPDMARAADWLVEQFKFAAMDAKVMATKGHPVVVAKNKHVAGRPTVLFYGHYDVQPPENDKGLADWKSPPFEPVVRKDDGGHDAIFARGAVDDKGQVWCHLDALTAWQAHGGAPVNVTCLIEGEEEIGSENLAAFVRENKELLQADVCLISDTGLFDRGVPALCYSLRGLVYEEIRLTGPSHDLHSGQFGGAVVNPAIALVELLSKLRNADGSVNIPGFYDDVRPLSDAEKQMWAGLPRDDEATAASIGLTAADLVGGEEGYTVLERIWARPTLEINGLTAGYQGEGAKTVIGNVASAKVSMRLVPNQDPAKIQKLFRAAVLAKLPKGVKVEFTLDGHNALPVITPHDTPAAKLALEALREGFEIEPTFIRGGGTIPVVGLLKEELGLDSLLVGFGLPDDRVHSPNEKFDLGCFHAGRRTAAVLYSKLAQLQSRHA